MFNWLQGTNLLEDKIKRDSVSKRSLTGRGLFPPKFAFTLLIPFRNIFLSPKELIERLNLKRTDSVLEIGPGPGYFSYKVSQAVPYGQLVLADIQQEMLEYAQKRLERKGSDNISYYLCNGRNFDFPDNSFDIIYMVTVLGEVENPQDYIREFCRMLKPGGTLSVSEQAGDPDKMGVEELIRLIEPAGFSFEKLYGNMRNFTVNFTVESFSKIDFF